MDVFERIEKGEVKILAIQTPTGENIIKNIGSNFMKVLKNQNKSDIEELLQLAKLGQRMQWVSVAERLPREDDVVLVWVGTAWVRACLGKTPYGQAWYLIDRNSYNNMHNVTHWMPLPPNPGEGE